MVVKEIPQKVRVPKKKKVCAYARVSVGKETMIHSLSNQVSFYSSLIQNEPTWLYAGVYSDLDYTGTKANRPGFQKMLEDCRNGKIDLVLCKSISRFARNTVDLLNTCRELKHLGIDVFFEEEIKFRVFTVIFICAMICKKRTRRIHDVPCGFDRLRRDLPSPSGGV